MWAPLAAVAVVALAAVVVPLVQKRQYAIALLAANADAAQEAHAADAVRQQLDSMQNDYNYILAKKYTYPSMVHLLDEVTRVLPDDTWLTQFEMKSSGRGKDAQRDVYLRGETADAGKLIALLEDSQLVEQAAPRSPTTKIQGASGEVFDLSARLRALPLPAAVAVAVVETPAPSPAPPDNPPATAAASSTAVPASDGAPPTAAPAPGAPAPPVAQSRHGAHGVAAPAPAAAPASAAASGLHDAPVLPHASAFGAAANGAGRAAQPAPGRAPPLPPPAAPMSQAPTVPAEAAPAPPTAGEPPPSPPAAGNAAVPAPQAPNPDEQN